MHRIASDAIDYLHERTEFWLKYKMSDTRNDDVTSDVNNAQDLSELLKSVERGQGKKDGNKLFKAINPPLTHPQIRTSATSNWLSAKSIAAFTS